MRFATIASHRRDFVRTEHVFDVESQKVIRLLEAVDDLLRAESFCNRRLIGDTKQAISLVDVSLQDFLATRQNLHVGWVFRPFFLSDTDTQCAVVVEKDGLIGVICRPLADEITLIDRLKPLSHSRLLKNLAIIEQCRRRKCVGVFDTLEFFWLDQTTVFGNHSQTGIQLSVFELSAQPHTSNWGLGGLGSGDDGLTALDSRIGVVEHNILPFCQSDTSMFGLAINCAADLITIDPKISGLS